MYLFPILTAERRLVVVVCSIVNIREVETFAFTGCILYVVKSTTFAPLVY